jgi:hypothetical protein
MPKRRASEIARHFAEHPHEPEDRPGRPELRVREDAPTVTVDSLTAVEVAINQLGAEPNGVVLRGQDGEIKAVMLSPERYADLAGVMIKAERQFVAASGAGFQPQSEDLEELMVEQVDPAAGWHPGARS